MQLNLRRVFATEDTQADINCRLNFAGYEYPAGDFPFKDDVTVTGSVENRTGIVYLSLSVSFDYFTVCDRCGRQLTEHYSIQINNILSDTTGNDGDEDILPVKDRCLDLDSVVIENMLLALPMKHLCKEDCKGLCPVCGQNLNDADCGHVH